MTVTTVIPVILGKTWRTDLFSKKSSSSHYQKNIFQDKAT